MSLLKQLITTSPPMSAGIVLDAFRKSHEVDGSTEGAQTDYQVKIKVYRGSGTDSVEKVYVEGKCLANFGDIRFRQGEVELDHWLEKAGLNAYLTDFSKSDSNPLKDFGEGYWITGFYNEYDGKIYLLIQPDVVPSAIITCWSFDLEDWETPDDWTDHGTVLTGTEAWEICHVEAHSVVWETQAMADAREGVGEGEGTRKWRMYYCACATGTPDYSVGIATASEENPTSWTKYAGNPVYGHGNATFHTGEGIADPEAFLFDGELWMAVAKYEGGVSVDQWFAKSTNGIDGWTDTVANLDGYGLVWGTCFQIEDVISWVSPQGSFFTPDGEGLSAYDGNPVIPDGAGGQWDEDVHGMFTLIKDKNENYFINGTAYLYYFARDAGGDDKLGVATTTTEDYEKIGVFWVEIPTIPADPESTTIHIYYGKADAETASNILNTMIKGDDGVVGNFTEDTGGTAAFSYVDGKYKITEDSADDTFASGDILPSWERAIALKVDEFTGNGILGQGKHMVGLFDEDVIGELCGTVAAVAGKRRLTIRREQSNDPTYPNEVVVTYIDVGGGDHHWDGNAWNGVVRHEAPGVLEYRIWSDGTNLYADVLSDGVSIFTNPASIAIASVKTFPAGICLAWVDLYTDAYWVVATVDNYFIRKYVDPEPAHGAWGAEEPVVWPF